jgi:hypothetical protein
LDALHELETLDDKDCTCSEARSAWDWVFKSDGFFGDFDGHNDDGNGPKGQKERSGLVETTPSRPVNHQGGGRFG